MPRAKRRSRQVIEEEEEEVTFSQQEAEEADLEEEDEEDASPPPTTRRRRSRSSSSRQGRRRQSAIEDEEDEGVTVEELEEEDDDNNGGADSQDQEMMFSSQVPELSQEIAPVRAGDRNNLNRLGHDAREKSISDVLQLVLFKGLAREPIDRSKILTEAGLQGTRFSSAIFSEVKDRLDDIFGFKLVAMPAYLQDIKDCPKRYKDRYYLLNVALLDPEGTHSREMHAVSPQGVMEKGLLMIVLGLIFCQGEPRSDGTRWLAETDLYALLHKVDDNISGQPPDRTSGKSSSSGGTASAMSFATGLAAGESPNVDQLLQKFVHMDYLWLAKDNEQLVALFQANHGGEAVDAHTWFYSMGPRAALEVGRKQVIHFCAEMMDEEPDPSMYEGIEDEAQEEPEDEEM